jgi:hypothetical protein
MLSSVRLLSHGRGVHQHPQPQMIGQAPFVPFLPFSDIPRLSLFRALQEGKIFGRRSASLARNARTGSFWPTPWLASLCSNGMHIAKHIAKHIASCFPKTTCHLDEPSLWRFRLAAHPPKTQKAHKALTKPTSLTFVSPTLLCPIALLPYYPTRARAMVA